MSSDVKYDDLFKSAITDKAEKNDEVGGSENHENAVLIEEDIALNEENSSEQVGNLLDEDSTSGFVSSEVNRSNTLDDIGDSELFKSTLEPSFESERINGATFSNAPAHLETTENISLFQDEKENPKITEKPSIFHEEKEISLDDDDEDQPQYEEEKLQVTCLICNTTYV